MSETVADARGFVYEPIRGPKRRVEFETQPDGSYLRIESEWTGCAWREIGREPCLSMRRI
jgi:hypothetical protein